MIVASPAQFNEIPLLLGSIINPCVTGVGEEADAICYSLKGALTHLLSSVSNNIELSELKFEYLKRRWKYDTSILSSDSDIALHPAYQQIIEMGEEAVSLILHDLDDELDNWFWALKEITGEDPVHPSDRGDMEKMRLSWLEWGRVNQII